jgi:hypothetical protein
MEALIDRSVYPHYLPENIERRGAHAIAIANRWLLGWPGRVKAMIGTGNYFDALDEQLEIETEVLVNEPNLPQLARHEILRLHEIREAPPAGA